MVESASQRSGPMLRDGSEATLGRRNRAGGARIQLGRHAQRSAKRLEHGFALMVRVVAAQIVDMQSHQRVVDEALEKLMRQVDIELPDHGARKGHMKFKSGPTGEINHHAR